ncbi:hypothetical protein Jiend_51110 [Micromonospora endophytica]|nr:hypothetical protein Jiend_51110 [Micromonospora endophytica]
MRPVLIAPWLLASMLVAAAFVVAIRGGDSGRRGRRGQVADEGTVEVIDALRRRVDSVLGG